MTKMPCIGQLILGISGKSVVSGVWPKRFDPNGLGTMLSIWLIWELVQMKYWYSHEQL